MTDEQIEREVALSRGRRVYEETVAINRAERTQLLRDLATGAGFAAVLLALGCVVWLVVRA